MIDNEAFAAAVARGRAAAENLNASTERLNEALLRAEAAIADLHLGVSASVFLRAGEMLRFQKDGKVWRLFVEMGDDTDRHLHLLVHASREVRVLAAARLPMLVEKMVSEVEETAKLVETAAAESSEFVEVLKAREP
jgi:hypothetical protein